MVRAFDPIGNPLDLGAFKVIKGGKVQVKGFPLPDTGAPYETGEYTARVKSGNGAGGVYKISASVKAPK